MTAAKREPVYYDGIAIDPDWLDAQAANYRPGCMNEAVRLMRAYERADIKRAARQGNAA